MIYEERTIKLSRNSFGEYREWFLSSRWPALRLQGHVPLCLVNGVIGKSVEDVLIIVGYENFDAFEGAQDTWAPNDAVEAESTRLLIPSRFRPDLPVLPEQRRPIYGVRRWWISPEEWLTFNRLSYEGVWPAMDFMGHYVLGQFRPLANDQSIDVLNLAGYRSVAHWEETRTPADHGVPNDLFEKLQTLGGKREALVQNSFVCLMRAHWPEL